MTDDTVSEKDIERNVFSNKKIVLISQRLFKKMINISNEYELMQVQKMRVLLVFEFEYHYFQICFFLFLNCRTCNNFPVLALYRPQTVLGNLADFYSERIQPDKHREIPTADV